MPTTVVVSGVSGDVIDALERQFRVRRIASLRDLDSVLGREPVQAVVIAAESDPTGTLHDLARYADPLREAGALVVLIGAMERGRTAHAPVGPDYYVCSSRAEPSSIAAVVGTALSDPGRAPGALAERIARDAELLTVFETLDAGSSVEEIASHVEHAAKSILQCERCRCVVGPTAATGSSANGAAPLWVGLSGYVSLTGEPVVVRAGERDPRWHGDTDAGGSDAVHFLAVPMALSGRRGGGVLTAIRPAAAESFSEEDVHRASALAACAAPVLDTARTRQLVAARLADRERDAASPSFSHSAREADRDRAAEATADTREPGWLQHAFWVSVLVALVIVCALSLKTVDRGVELPFVITSARSDHPEAGTELVAALPPASRGRLDFSRLAVTLTFTSAAGERVDVRLSGVTIERLETRHAAALRSLDPPNSMAEGFVIRAGLPRSVLAADGTTVELHDGMRGIARFDGASRSLLSDLLPGAGSTDPRAARRSKG